MNATYEFKGESTRFFWVADDVDLLEVADGVLILLVLEEGVELGMLANGH